MNHKPMLNLYPDSLAGSLKGAVEFLQREELKDVFSSLYVLPSLYHSDLDRGFCVVDYDLNEELATETDLKALKKLGLDLKLDFVLNHASMSSPQFQDLLEKGESSEYADFFIDWNEFWEGCGSMTDEGYIQPDPKYLEQMFFRKPGLPILMVEMPDGTKKPYWNTFYQKVWEESGKVRYAGQMDLDIRSEKVWDFYKSTLTKLKNYGASLIRLDAFAYAPKGVGQPNFLNRPQTWQVLERVSQLSEKQGLELLPEIHATYQERIHEEIASQGYWTYDFFLPGLVLHAIERQDGQKLAGWGREILEKGLRTVNMLGCHDGIPMLDLKGILSETEIQQMIGLLKDRGGFVKNLHGAKNMYYQVNSTYFSALGEDDRKLLLARAIQLFMPGKPQIWYLDLLAGTNDYKAMEEAGPDGHKEINRTNLTKEQVLHALNKPVVEKQLELIRLRNMHPAFSENAQIDIQCPQPHLLEIRWSHRGDYAELDADLKTGNYKIKIS